MLPPFSFEEFKLVYEEFKRARMVPAEQALKQKFKKEVFALDVMKAVQPEKYMSYIERKNQLIREAELPVFVQTLKDIQKSYFRGFEEHLNQDIEMIAVGPFNVENDNLDDLPLNFVNIVLETEPGSYYLCDLRCYCLLSDSGGHITITLSSSREGYQGDVEFNQERVAEPFSFEKGSVAEFEVPLNKAMTKWLQLAKEKNQELFKPDPNP